MPDEKIEISFDDEKKKPGEGPSGDPLEEEGRIVIDFDEEKTGEEIKEEDKVIPPSQNELILSSNVDSFYKASPQLNNFYHSDIKFPEGIEKGFRENGKTDFKDTFLNSILENNKYIVLSSISGSVYIIDRFAKKLKTKMSFDNESFEKTGLIYGNRIFLNSINSIYKIEESDIESNISPGAIYNTDRDHYIWSSLNRDKDIIVFLEYSPASKTGNIVQLNSVTKERVNVQNFPVQSYLNPLLVILNGIIYYITDNSLYMLNLSNNELTVKTLNFEADESNILFASGNKLYLTSKDGKVYFLESGTDGFKFTGIYEHYINSCAAFEGNIFIGTDSGWKYYNSNGVLIYSHDDVEENKIEAVNKNMLIVSRRNKIVFHNLTRFQEAEGFVIRTKDELKNQEIFSSVISFNDIYVLTKDGILSSFTNDKLNIHI